MTRHREQVVLYRDEWARVMDLLTRLEFMSTWQTRHADAKTQVDLCARAKRILIGEERPQLVAEPLEAPYRLRG